MLLLLRVFALVVLQDVASVAALTSEASKPKAVYLGLDVGTQGTKLLAYCPEEGRVIARVSRSYDIMPTSVPGRAEQDPNETWMPAIDECFTELGNILENSDRKIDYKIKGIGVSGQQHGMVALDSQLQPLRPAKLWCDVEAVEETKLLQASCKEEEFNLDFLTPSFTAPKILWMKRNEPELFQKAKWFVLPHDYVVMKLANLRQPITDAGDASGNGIYISSTRQNSKTIANAIDESLIVKLPTVLSPNQVAGILDDAFMQKLLPNAPPSTKAIPLSVGSGDNMCSALGVGCVSPGQAVLSLGTSGTIFAVSDSPVSSSPVLAPFCDAAGRHLPLACTISCTGVLTQVLNEFTDWSSHEVASEHAAAVEIGCHGITFLPYLGGERTPNWPHASGALLGLTSSNLRHASDPAVVYRACLEGISFLLADAMNHFPNKDEIKTLLVVGGGAKNPLWQQMIADILNCRLEFPLEGESAALGAAFQAGAAATGATVEDYVLQQKIDRNPIVVEPKNHAAYQEAFQRYKDFGNRLFDER